MLQRPVVQRQRIGPAIRKLRHEQALTLDDLAAQAGISASHLSRLERGQTLPSFTVLAGIAHVLGVSIDEFAQLEQDVTVLDHELGDMLTSLGLDDTTRDEFLSLSIESRRVLANVIHALAAMPISTQESQTQALRSITDRGLVESSQALGKLIAASGLSPVGFTRALIWLNTAPGQKRMLLARPGLIGMPAPRFSLAYRALTGTDPIAPEIAAWWQHSERAHNIRTIVSRGTIRGYLRDGAWFKGGPVSSAEERQEFVERISSSVDTEDVELAVTDMPLGDINIRMSPDDVLLETTRHRGGVEHLGMVLRGHEATDTVARRFDSIWDSLPDEESDPEAVRAWLRDQVSS
jgi:transcriptional regulator with XRE-family HTH domain